MRRRFLIISMMAFMSLYAGIGCSSAQEKPENKPEEKNDVEQTDIPKVYMFKAIDSENLVKIYEALGREATGKVAVKLSTGEPGGHNFLQPALIKDLIQKVDGTIVECNTAYGGGRANTESHRKAAEDHGKIHLIERIDSRHGMHTLDHTETIGLGIQKYELIKLD